MRSQTQLFKPNFQLGAGNANIENRNPNLLQQPSQTLKQPIKFSLNP